MHYEVTRYLKLKGARALARSYEELVAAWERLEILGGDWDVAADLWAERHRVGRPIEDSDLLIAVGALQSGATLVTNNTDHFEDLGIEVENWAVAPALPANAP